MRLLGKQGYLQPVPSFVHLAGALLCIACGEHIAVLDKLYEPSFGVDRAWKALRELVELISMQLASGVIAEPEILPFILAARGCLQFHDDFQYRILSQGSEDYMQIAWKIVFDEVLSKIGRAFVLEDPAPTTYCLKERAVEEKLELFSDKSLYEAKSLENIEFAYKIPEVIVPVLLFDDGAVEKNSMLHERQEKFFNSLDDFHASYKRFFAPPTDNLLEGPQRVRIAILDTGIYLRHSIIEEAKRKGRINEERCYSWIGNSEDYSDIDSLHGTNCAHILHKTAPEVDIYSTKIFDSDKFHPYEAKNIAKAIDYAVNEWSVNIISMSFRLRRRAVCADEDRPKENAALEEYEKVVSDIEKAIEAASSRCVIFAAASNDGKGRPRAFPASAPNVICIHASDGFGNEGGISPSPEITGNFMTLGICHELQERKWREVGGTLFPSYSVVCKSGTSYATPVAAGIAAAVLHVVSNIEGINDRTKAELKRSSGMKKMLLMLSSPREEGKHYNFVAPWNWSLWESGWQADERKVRMAWDSINHLFSVR